MATSRGGVKSTAARKARTTKSAAPGRSTPKPGPVDPSKPPRRKPRPKIPIWTHAKYGVHGMFGVVSAQDSSTTIPMAGETRVQHGVSIGTRVTRTGGKAWISYAVALPVSSPSAQVFFRGVRVTYSQDYSFRVATKRWYAPLRGVTIWDGTKKIGELMWPATVYTKNLGGAVQSAWFLRGPAVREPITQGLTISVAADFTVDDKEPFHDLAVRFLEVEISTLAVEPERVDPTP